MSVAAVGVAVAVDIAVAVSILGVLFFVPTTTHTYLSTHNEIPFLCMYPAHERDQTGRQAGPEGRCEDLGDFFARRQVWHCLVL